MLDAELLKSIAAQLMTSASVRVEGKSIPVRRTSRQRLKNRSIHSRRSRISGDRTESGEAEPMGATGAEWSSGRAIQGRRAQQVRGGCGGWRSYVLRHGQEAILKSSFS